MARTHGLGQIRRFHTMEEFTFKLGGDVQPALGLSAELILNMGVAHDGASAI